MVAVLTWYVKSMHDQPKPITDNSLKAAFWRGMGVINILTDLALILFPVHVIVTLQMSLSKKITILTFFGARSLYVLDF